MRLEFSIPFSTELTEEDTWIDVDNGRQKAQKTKFFIARCHFALQIKQSSDPISYGNIIAAFEAPEGVSHGKIRSLEYEHREINFEKTVSQALMKSDHVHKFISELSGVLGVKNVSQIEVKDREEVLTKLSSTFSKEFSLERTSINTVTESVSLSTDIHNTVNKRLVFVEGFKRIEADLVLTYIDYIYVSYKTNMFGMRKVRKKVPSFNSDGSKRNIIKIDKPLSKFSYWQQMKNSSLVIPEGQWTLQVNDPEEIIIQSINQSDVVGRGFPKVPSLYQISNAAFPLKWIKRRGDWTEDDLIKIEDSDSKKRAIRFRRDTHDQF